MTFSIITPSFGQLDPLKLCIASVADQGGVECAGEKSQGTQVKKYERGNVNKFGSVDLPTLLPSPFPTHGFAVEHLIQDWGTPGIEAWARDICETLRSQHGGIAIPELEPFELAHFRAPTGYTLRIFKQPDAGMYDAINKGMARASGDVLSYLNCDEQYLPDALATAAACFAEDAATDVLFGDALLTREDGSLLSYRRVVPPRPLHIRLCHLGVWSCAMFYRRRVWEAGHRFPADLKAIGDAVFVHGVVKAGFRARTLARPLASFAMGEGNLGQTPAALAEARQWRGGMGRWGTVLRPLVKAGHWLEKARAGAYRRRDVVYAIYTPQDPAQRKTQTCREVSWRWKGGS